MSDDWKYKWDRETDMGTARGSERPKWQQDLIKSAAKKEGKTPQEYVDGTKKQSSHYCWGDDIRGYRREQ